MAGRFLASRFKGGKVAIVHDRTTYGRGLADETRRHMSAAGLKEVLYEGYVAGDKDYSALVAKLKAIAVDVVYIGGYHTEAALIVRRMRNQGLQAPVVAGDTLVTLEYWQLTGKAGEGTLFTFSPDPRRSPAAADVARRFRDSKIEPEGYVLYAYAAIETWARAATAAGSEDAKAVTARLQADEFSTVLGAFRFDRKGDPSLPPYKLYQWKDGKYEQID